MASPDAAREIACPMVAQAVDFVLQLLPSSPWTPSTYQVAWTAREPDCKPFASVTICRFACICGIAPGVPISCCDPLQPASNAAATVMLNAWASPGIFIASLPKLHELGSVWLCSAQRGSVPDSVASLLEWGSICRPRTLPLHWSHQETWGSTFSVTQSGLGPSGGHQRPHARP